MDSRMWSDPNPLPQGPRDVVTVDGPSAAVAVDVSLAFLGENGVDISRVIGDIQNALAQIVSDGGTVEAATLAAAASEVPGVAAGRSCSVGGGTSAEGGFVLPSSVSVDVRIVP